ncbi:MAG: hypothetical protein JWM86_2863 [Thermoleophilia bacterium]|nr:hypothetical protein [Thermoleophilia bacterium]
MSAVPRSLRQRIRFGHRYLDHRLMTFDLALFIEDHREEGPESWIWMAELLDARGCFSIHGGERPPRLKRVSRPLTRATSTAATKVAWALLDERSELRPPWVFVSGIALDIPPTKNSWRMAEKVTLMKLAFQRAKLYDERRRYWCAELTRDELAAEFWIDYLDALPGFEGASSLATFIAGVERNTLRRLRRRLERQRGRGAGNYGTVDWDEIMSHETAVDPAFWMDVVDAMRSVKNSNLILSKLLGVPDSETDAGCRAPKLRMVARLLLAKKLSQ